MTTAKLRNDRCELCVKSLGWINIGGNSLIALLKLFLGIVGHSNALFADGIHSFGDVLGSCVMVFSLRVAKKKTDQEYPFGYGKVEFIAAIAIYISLFIIGVYIFEKAVEHLIHRVAIKPDMVTIIGAAISLVANELMYRQSICCGNQLNSPSMVANAHEKRADMWASGIVLLGIVGAKMGFYFFDPIAAIIVAFLIFRLCAESTARSIRGLMDHSLDKDNREIIWNELSKHDVVIRNLRTREVGQNVDVEVDLYVEDSRAMKDLEVMRRQIRNDVLAAVGRPGEVTVYFYPKSKLEV